MTSEEKQEIINAVLAALRTNSKSIDQLTPVSEMSDTDFLELNGGRKVSYGVLFANHMSNDEANEAWEYLDTNKVDKDLRGLVEVHQAPVVFLDAMGILDGHALNGSDGLEYRPDYKQILDFPDGKIGAPKQGAVYISKNNFKKYIWNGTDMEELKPEECPLFVDYMEPVAFATLPVGGSYYVPSSHKIAVKIDASNTKTYDPLPDALYFFRDKGKVYTWNSSTNKWVPVSSDINVVNNLTDGGEGDALSAEMGKWLYTNLYTIFTQLGNYAFPNGKPQIDWGGGNPPVIPPCSVSKTIGTGLSSTGGDSDVAFGDPLEVSIAITDNLYIVDDDSVVVTMGGSPVQGAWNASTMKVTIAAVTGNVVINVPSLTYVSSGLAFQLDAKNGLDITNQKWTDLVGGIEFALTNVTLNQGGTAAVFDGTAKGIADQGLNVPASTGTIEIIATRASNTAVSPIMRNAYGTGCITAHMEINNSQKVFEFYVANDDSIPAGGNYGIVCEDLNVAISANHERALVNGMVYTGNRYNNVVGLSGVEYPLTIGYSKRNGNDFFLNGTIMAIRVYSGTLSEQEMKRNYSIDKKRFNLA